MFTTNTRQSEANPQSLNRYAYVGNDPVNFTDPSGLEMIADCGADQGWNSGCGVGGGGTWSGYGGHYNGSHFGGLGVLDQAENQWAYRRDCAFYGGCDTQSGGGNSGGGDSSGGVSADVWIYGHTEVDVLRILNVLASGPYQIKGGHTYPIEQGLDMQEGMPFEIAAGNAAGKALGSIIGRIIGSLVAGRTTGTAVSILESNAGHIFRDEAGHLIDTPTNRELLINVASKAENFLGSDQFGNQWHAKILQNGQQIWTSSRSNVIRNGGINATPRDFNPLTGLSRSTRP